MAEGSDKDEVIKTEVEKDTFGGIGMNSYLLCY